MAEDQYHKDRIGNRKLRPETLMLGYGYDPALSEGAVKPPVFLTSTFVFTSAEHGKEFFDYVAGRREPPRGSPAGSRSSTDGHWPSWLPRLGRCCWYPMSAASSGLKARAIGGG